MPNEPPCADAQKMVDGRNGIPGLVKLPLQLGQRNIPEIVMQALKLLKPNVHDASHKLN